MKTKAILCIALLVSSVAAVKVQAQQNIQFTQYIFNTLSVNPAYAGYKEEWFAQLALRRQWVGINEAPQTGQLSIDGVTDPINKRMGLGLQVTADGLGPQSATSIYANYAYRLRLDRHDTQRLSFGIGAGVTQYGLDGNKLRAVNPNDPTLPAGKISSFIPDLRFGICYYNPRWYLGASVMDLLSGDQSNNIFRWDNNTTENLKRKRHVYLMTGMLLGMDAGTKFRPSLLIKEDFKGPTSLDLNAMFIFGDRFWLGGSYRTGVTLWEKEYTRNQSALSKLNSVSAITEIYINDRFRIGYSYDYIISRLSSVQHGTHEITLGLTFPGKGNRLLSPRFF